MMEMTADIFPRKLVKKSSKFFEQSSGRCFYCGKQIVLENRSSGRGVWEPDHLMTFSGGNGSNVSTNLAAACKSCNRDRNNMGNSTPTQYQRDKDQTPRCQGHTKDGLRCKNPVTEGNYKYCYLHSK